MKYDNKHNKLKHHVVDYLESLCDKSKISNKTLGIYLRGWHIWAPFAMLIGIFRDTFIVCMFYLVAQFLLLIAFYVFNGCLLTSLERRLCPDNTGFTFVDPIIEILDLELNDKARYDISVRVAIIYILITIIVLSYRFL